MILTIVAAVMVLASIGYFLYFRYRRGLGRPNNVHLVLSGLHKAEVAINDLKVDVKHTQLFSLAILNSVTSTNEYIRTFVEDGDTEEFKGVIDGLIIRLSDNLVAVNNVEFKGNLFILSVPMGKIIVNRISGEVETSGKQWL
jgi:hypothetical protein